MNESHHSPFIYIMEFKQKINLSGLTTIHCGGDALWYAECQSDGDLSEALDFAESNNLRVQVLGGGSNIIFQDAGFDGLIIRYIENEITADKNIITAKAGADWDALVEFSIEKNLQGLECLSGIPGLAGASPIQNIGAYGAEVKTGIVYVKCFDRLSKKFVTYETDECDFGYRTSAFKTKWKDKFIITEVCYSLNENKEPEILYPELKAKVEKIEGYSELSINEKLRAVRAKVIEIRKRKSMVLNPNDENTKSCGSFFTNPVIPEARYNLQKHLDDVPAFKTDGGYKLSAARMIELAGFRRGDRYKGVGISRNHTLALVNYSGNTEQLLTLADKIKTRVYKKFGIQLVEEPNIIY